MPRLRPRSAAGSPAMSAPGRASQRRRCSPCSIALRKRWSSSSASTATGPRGRAATSTSRARCSPGVAVILPPPSPTAGGRWRRRAACRRSTAFARRRCSPRSSATPASRGWRRRRSRRVLEALGPGESLARTRTALACVLQRSGQDAAAHAALAAAFEEAGERARFVLRSEWPQVEEVLWSALEAGALDAAPAVEALDAAFPGGSEVVALLEHPRTEVRAAALAAAAAAGRPEALARLAAERFRERPRSAQAPSAATLVPDPGTVRDPPRGLCGGRRPLGAQGRGARRPLPAGSGRRARSRGRAARRVLEREAARLGTAWPSDRDLERARRARSPLGGDQAACPGALLRARAARRRPRRRRRVRGSGPPGARGRGAGANRGA